MEMTVDFRRSLTPLPPRFLDSTISQDLKWSPHIDSVQKKAQQRLYFLRQLRKFNLPKELLNTFYSAIIQSVICTSITVWFGSATKRDRARLQRTMGLQRGSLELTFPPSRTCTGSGSGKGQQKSLQTPHILVTNCSTSFRLVGDTGHCSPKPADTETASFPKQSLC